MKENETCEVLALGTTVDRKHRKLWKKLEKDIFRDDPHHIPSGSPPKGKKGGDIEFFFLYCEGKPVGRASTVVGEGWLSDDEKRKDVGFIDALLVHPDYKHVAGRLVERCVSSLKARKAVGVIARSRGFCALAAQDFDDVAPGHLPSNPAWHVDVFEQQGFVRHKEWANFRLTLPPEASQLEVAKWDALVTSRGMKVKRLTGRSRKEVKKYADVAYEVLSEHYGYTPTRFMDSYSLVRLVIFVFMTRLARFKIYGLYDEAGELKGFVSYHPDYNIAQNTVAKYYKKKWYDLTTLKIIPEFFWAIRHCRRATVGSIGLREDVRRKGLARSMDWGIKLVLQDGYKQIDTGPVLTDNAVVVKIAENLGRRYGMSVERMRYYTMKYEFKPDTKTDIVQ